MKCRKKLKDIAKRVLCAIVILFLCIGIVVAVFFMEKVKVVLLSAIVFIVVLIISLL